jgi:hypothetical protein
MRASGLGKVSRDKRRRATTSDNTIAANRDERNQRCSYQEAPKCLRHEPLEREEEAKAISFEATSGLANERDKNVVRVS